jgi:hypothetical protein
MALTLSNMVSKSIIWLSIIKIFTAFNCLSSQHDRKVRLNIAAVGNFSFRNYLPFNLYNNVFKDVRSIPALGYKFDASIDAFKTKNAFIIAGIETRLWNANTPKLIQHQVITPWIGDNNSDRRSRIKNKLFYVAIPVGYKINYRKITFDFTLAPSILVLSREKIVIHESRNYIRINRTDYVDNIEPNLFSLSLSSRITWFSLVNSTTCQLRVFTGIGANVGRYKLSNDLFLSGWVELLGISAIVNK